MSTFFHAWLVLLAGVGGTGAVAYTCLSTCLWAGEAAEARGLRVEEYHVLPMILLSLALLPLLLPVVLVRDSVRLVRYLRKARP